MFSPCCWSSSWHVYFLSGLPVFFKLLAFPSFLRYLHVSFIYHFYTYNLHQTACFLKMRPWELVEHGSIKVVTLYKWIMIMIMHCNICDKISACTTNKSCWLCHIRQFFEYFPCNKWLFENLIWFMNLIFFKLEARDSIWCYVICTTWYLWCDCHSINVFIAYHNSLFIVFFLNLFIANLKKSIQWCLILAVTSWLSVSVYHELGKFLKSLIDFNTFLSYCWVIYLIFLPFFHHWPILSLRYCFVGQSLSVNKY